MIRLGIDVETVAVVRPESRGESELDIPGVREHGDDIGQGQGPLLLTDGGVAGPGEVTTEAPSVNRLRVSQIKISFFRVDIITVRFLSGYVTVA